MTFTTKFKVGDTAFVLYNNKIQEVVVTGVYIFHEFDVNHFNQGVNCRVKFEAGGETKIEESSLYSSKQELINSL